MNTVSIKKYRNRYDLFVLMMLFLCPSLIFSQAMEEDKNHSNDVSVSPSHLKFNVDVGKSSSQKIKISNFTKTKQKYKVVYSDFVINKKGKSKFQEAGTNDHSLHKFLEFSPTFLEIDPGSSAELTLSVSIPDESEAGIAAWGVVLIEPLNENNEVDSEIIAGNSVKYGISPSSGYGIWVYQNPSSVNDLHVDITNFIFEKKVDNNLMFMRVKNKGDGISFCNASIEITNLATGEQKLLKGEQASIMPGCRRTFIFDLEGELPKGNYSAVGVLGYNSDVEFAETELIFKVD